MPIRGNLVHETSTTTGTGNLTTVAVRRRGSDAFGTADLGADNPIIFIHNRDVPTEYEIAPCYWSAAGTLVRGTPVESSNANAAVSFSAGTKDIFNDVPGFDQGVPESTVVFTIKTTAPYGWLLFDDGTMGNAGSGATYANALAKRVFFDLFNNANDTNCPIKTSANGATTRAAQTNATTAWAALCRMTLPKTLGRALAVAGAGSGLTSRAIAAALGEETHTPTLAEIFAHTHSYNDSQTPSPGTTAAADGSTGVASPVSASDVGRTTGSAGSSTPFNVIDPRVHLNAMVKL